MISISRRLTAVEWLFYRRRAMLAASARLNSDSFLELLLCRWLTPKLNRNLNYWKASSLLRKRKYFVSICEHRVYCPFSTRKVYCFTAREARNIMLRPKQRNCSTRKVTIHIVLCHLSGN